MKAGWFPRWLRAAVLLLCLAHVGTAQQVGSFSVHFDTEVFLTPFSGDVFVAFSDNDRREPRRAMHSWFGASPSLRFEVKDVAPGAVLVLRPADAVASYPVDWSTVEAKSWYAQAAARRSRTGRQAGLDEGDAHSATFEIAYDPSGDDSIRLSLASVVEARPFRETERVKLFEMKSEALSRFHGFDYTLRAGVLLPRDYAEGETYPVVYSITGFGGTHASIHRFAQRVEEGSVLDRAIVVVPDATNRYGHSVFCDSRSIGPWGEALVHELIPVLEAKFGGAGAEHRYVTGVSSGGWSSLWLQVAYPDAFAGCWSHAPDPIDFHDFQQIDLYDPLPDGSPRNMYVDEEGHERPLARRGDEVTLTYREFVQRENVTNPGGQIRSFEATFGPPAPDGTPSRVFDVATGAIDHEVAKTWLDYDISHRLLTRWDELRPKLSGKVHVYAGEVDTFYLEGAVERFRALASEKGMLDDIVVEVIPGMAHARYQEGHRQMLETIEARWKARVMAER